MKPFFQHPVEADNNALVVGTRQVRKWDWLWKKKHVCPWWLAHTFDNRFRNRVHPAEKILSPYLRPGMRALDIGCGMGYFSLALAGLVGPAGLVISADIQTEMLQKTSAKARRIGLGSVIRPILMTGGSLILDKEIDFALAFWMAHEVDDLPLMLGRIHHYLKPGGRFLLAEPLIHVSKRRFDLETALAMETGLRIESEPRIRFSRATVFVKS